MPLPTFAIHIEMRETTSSHILQPFLSILCIPPPPHPQQKNGLFALNCL